jgi:hypothetical protein
VAFGYEYWMVYLPEFNPDTFLSFDHNPDGGTNLRDYSGGREYEKSNYAVVNEQCPGGFPTAFLDLSSKETSKFLLLSKRSYAIIRVGYLKVDSP